MVELENNETSMFNSAYYEIQSVSLSFQRCKYNSTKGNFEEWRWELDAIWRELSKDARKIESKAKSNTKQYSNQISGLNKLIDIAFKSRNRSLMYKYLEKKELALRYLWEDSGKGSKYIEEDDEL